MLQHGMGHELATFRHQELLREAEHERLVREALAGQTAAGVGRAGRLPVMSNVFIFVRRAIASVGRISPNTSGTVARVMHR